MMGVWRRMAELTKARLNDMMDRVEDPVTMLNYYVRDIEADIDRAESAAARRLAAANRLKERHEDALMVAAKAGLQAAQALQAGCEEEAKQAVESRFYYEQKAVEYADLYTQAKADADGLLVRLEELKEARRQMSAKRQELASRALAAEAKKREAATAAGDSGLADGSAQRGYRRIEANIAGLAPDEALCEPAGRGGSASGAARRAALDEALRRLRAQAAIPASAAASAHAAGASAAAN